MKRNEWIAVLALLLVTAVTVAFGSPNEAVPHGEIVQAEGQATPDVIPNETTGQPDAPAQAEARATASAPATAHGDAAPSADTPSPAATSTERPTASPRPTRTASPTPTVTPSATPFLFDTRPDLDRFVYVDQKVQHMFVFERGELVRDLLCSTGLPTDTTYTEEWRGYIGRYWGTFFSFGTYQDNAWYLYQSLGSILVHGLPYTEEDGYRTYQGREFLGVQPSSHGCIRLAPEDAQWFTHWDPEGVYMVITDPYLEYWR
ncbi:MAG: L,D-transpeptidase family protein [Chloroflexi bacterium]|nr:L,D-transpeptidase family protein [Chloroflexota bacterium]